MTSYDKFITPNAHALNETYSVKILICYFLRQMSRPLTPDQLTEIATDDGLINYFMFTEALNQLLDDGTVRLEKPSEEDAQPVYVLSDMGKAGADQLKNMLPKSLRNKILATGLKFFAKLKNERDVSSSVTELKQGYAVGIRCVDGQLMLMDLTLYAPNLAQAELLQEKIVKNPVDFYAKTIDLALEGVDRDGEPSGGSVETSVFEMERGYAVGIRCADGQLMKMDLKLYAPDREQTELLQEKAAAYDPEDLYSKILGFAMENGEYDPEPKEVLP